MTLTAGVLFQKKNFMVLSYFDRWMWKRRNKATIHGT